MLPALMLANADNAFLNLFDTMTQAFSKVDMLARPEELLPILERMSIVWAVIFIIAGVLTLLNGYRFYKAATIILALMIGLFAGYAMGQHINEPMIVGACCGVLFAVIAWPLMAYAVAILGALAGSFIGANIWTSVCQLDAVANAMPDGVGGSYWIGALIGLIVFGMLSFILFKLAVVMFTSISGSTMIVFGLVALLLQFQPWHASVNDSLSAHAMIVPLLVIVPAIIGLILQQPWSNAGAPPAAAAGAK